MSKRFTDTELWDKEWYMKLTIKEKLLVRFLFDKCNPAGIWTPNWVLASAYIGEKVSYEDLVNFSYRLEFLGGGKIFIPDFIEFQYGKLSENCKPHLKIIETLKKHELYERVFKGYTNPIQRVEEQEQYKEEEKEKDKDAEGTIAEFVFKKWCQYPAYPEHKFSLDEEDINRTVEFIYYTRSATITNEKIKEQWKAFQVNTFDGKKFYQEKADCLKHFRNWLKDQKIYGNKHSTGSKPAVQTVDAGRGFGQL